MHMHWSINLQNFRDTPKKIKNVYASKLYVIEKVSKSSFQQNKWQANQTPNEKNIVNLVQETKSTKEKNLAQADRLGGPPIDPV